MDVFPVALLQLFLQEVVEVEVDDGVVEVLARGQRLVVRLAQTREVAEDERERMIKVHSFWSGMRHSLDVLLPVLSVSSVSPVDAGEVVVIVVVQCDHDLGRRVLRMNGSSNEWPI